MNKTVWKSFRMSQDENEIIERNRALLGMSKANYIRFVATLPIDFIDGKANDNAIILIDKNTSKKIYFDLNRQGINLSQGIKALNSIAKKLKYTQSLNNDIANNFASQLEDINKNLGHLLVRNDMFLEKLDPLMESAVIKTVNKSP